jgi:hypothetical protein
MDKRTSAVGSDAKQAAELEKDIEDIRGNLDAFVAELDHRRHRLSPVRIAREHASLSAIAGASIAVGITIGGLFLYRAYRSRARRQRSWLERGRRLSSALGQLMAGKAVKTSPAIGWRIATAAATAASAVASRRLARRLFRPPQAQPGKAATD